jgi:hypothetical protein
VYVAGLIYEANPGIDEFLGGGRGYISRQKEQWAAILLGVIFGLSDQGIDMGAIEIGILELNVKVESAFRRTDSEQAIDTVLVALEIRGEFDGLNKIERSKAFQERA